MVVELFNYSSGMCYGCFCSHQVAILGECSAEIIECAYQYGRNVGIAFQVSDQIITELCRTAPG